MLSILFRGYLESCNYDCAYCPFAKRDDDASTRERDRTSVERFAEWASGWSGELAIFFTPWGEALTRAWYRDAIARLSHMPHLQRVAVQTNLSMSLGFLDECQPSRVALWCTFHPTQVSRERFVARCYELAERGIRFSVGVVGQGESLDMLDALKRELPRDTYVWVNAVRTRRYSKDELAKIAEVDPYFASNLRPPPSRGAPCRAGETVIAVDGAGNVRRCHFVKDVIGNLYEAGWEKALAPRPCPNAACGCHIGYVHRRDLPLYEAFEGGILERIAKR